MPTSSELESLVALAGRAANAAGAIIRSAASGLAQSVEELKGRNDVVTETDRLAQSAIEEIIRHEHPDHVFIGEETHRHSVREEGLGYRWIVDPIDGTTNFVHRLPPYAVSIAVMYDSSIVAGAVLNVSTNELFTAARGCGAMLDGQAIRVSDRRHLSDSLIATGFPERSFAELDRVLQTLGRVMQQCRGVRRPGAASVDLANTACGRLEGFYEEGLQAWDIAAGVLLVREAGGVVTNYQGADELFTSRTIVASNSHVHQALVECIEG